MTWIRGILAIAYLALNTFACAAVLLSLAMIKLLIPVDVIRKPVDRMLNAIAERWIANNSILLGDVQWDVRGVEGLNRSQWYLVEANHQSWADIFVLQKVLTGRIPLLKFFLKRELIQVPVIGLAWWALDFPFMKRHSEEFLREHPERRGDDLAEIRRSCEKFSLIPTAVMNFVEGTRFAPEKQKRDESPYRHLLPPKAGGIALALNVMGERFHSLLDVTIYYPGGAPTFFGMLAGRMKQVVVRMRELPLPPELIGGNYESDPTYRARAREWVNELWREKDVLLEALAKDSELKIEN